MRVLMLKPLLVLLSYLAPSLLLVVFSAPPDPPTPEPEKAIALTIEYRVGRESRSVIVRDRATVARMVAQLQVRKHEPGPAASSGPPYVKFEMPDGRVLVTMLLKPDILEVDGWGWLRLRDRKFYDAVVAEVSKAEGRQVELLPEEK